MSLSMAASCRRSTTRGIEQPRRVGNGSFITRLVPLIADRETGASDARRADRTDWRLPGVDLLVERILDCGEQLDPARPPPRRAAVHQRGRLQFELIHVVVELRADQAQIR